MRLNQSEALIAEKVIARIDVRASHWWWMRWLILFASFVFLTVAMMLFLVVRSRSSMLLSESFGDDLVREGLDAAGIKVLVDIRGMQWFGLACMVASAAVHAIVGAVGCGAVLGQWNRDVYDRLLAQALRSQVGELSPKKESAETEPGVGADSR